MILGMGMLAGAVRGEEGAADPEGTWRFNLVPFYWAPNIDVNLQVAGLSQNTQKDFLEESGVFKPHTLGVGFGALKQEWGFLFHLESFSTDLDFTLPDESFGQVDFDSQRLDLALIHGWHHPLYKGSDLYVTPWLGLRYRHAGLKLQAGRASTPDDDGITILQNEDNHWVEPYAGFRAQWVLDPRWSLSASGDIDGFLQDEISWSGSMWVKRHWGKEFSLGLGYRYDDFDFKHGSGNSMWAAEGSSQGVVIAMELDFFVLPSVESGAWGHLPRLLPPAERTAENAIPAGMKETDLPDAPAPPVEDGPLGQSLERSHNFINDKLDFGVESVDSWLLSDERSRVPRKKSRFFLSLDSRVTEQTDGETVFELKPSVDAKLELPNLEHQLKVVVSNNAVDEKPGEDTFDREEGVNVGLERSELFLKKTKFKFGVRSSLDLYTSYGWTPEWKRDSWRVTPQVRGYYRTDKGAGLIGSVGIHFRIKDRYRASWLSSVEAGDETNWNSTWLQNLSAAYYFEGTEEENHRAVFMNLSVKGSWGNQKAESYRWMPLQYRAPLYKNWLYWELGPEITWKEEGLWKPEPSLRFAISSLFWGTEER